MTAQRNMYCLAYASIFSHRNNFVLETLHNLSYCLTLSPLKDQRPVPDHAQSHGLGIISSHSVGFEQSWSAQGLDRDGLYL